jgi:Uncharacterized conserved protein (DUF2278)
MLQFARGPGPTRTAGARWDDRVMPLPQYGVVTGTPGAFTRDPQHHFGSWYHGHLEVAVAGAVWQSALDVDAPQAVGVSYRIVSHLGSAALGRVAELPDGFQLLDHAPTSGALDYVRSGALADGLVVSWVRRLLLRLAARRPWTPPPADVGHPGGPDPGRFTPAPFGPTPLDAALAAWARLARRLDARLLAAPRLQPSPWIASNGDNALDALGRLLADTRRVHIYGERFEDGGDGVHDVHMNQGDPAGSQWYPTNGPWQDGAVACRLTDGSVAVWQVRFNTQSLDTDAAGHPRS